MRWSPQNFRLWFKGWSKQQRFQRQEDHLGVWWDSLSERGWRSESLIVAMRMETHEFQDTVIIFQHFSNLLVYFMFKRCVCVCFRVAWMVHLILGLYEDTWIPDISKWSKMWDERCLYSSVVFSCIYHSSSPLLFFSHSSSPNPSSIRKKEKMRFYNLMICNNHKACRWVAWIKILILLEAG